MVPHTYEYVEEVVVPRNVEYQERKTYIGTYTNELEAVKVFDFYSILLNNITATTNFDYTKKDIIEMIENFFQMMEKINLNGSFIQIYSYNLQRLLLNFRLADYTYAFEEHVVEDNTVAEVDSYIADPLFSFSVLILIFSFV